MVGSLQASETGSGAHVGLHERIGVILYTL